MCRRENFQGNHIENYVGDTITIDIPNIHPLLGEKISVRINGKKPCEKEAATAAKLLVKSTLKDAKQIDLNNIGRDKYFRILADVSADQILIKDLLLKNKLAYECQGKMSVIGLIHGPANNFALQ